MKHLQLIIRSLTLVGILVFLNSCGDKIEGTFYISDEAKKYQIDTTITSFVMMDNYGISEEFYLNSRSSPHLYFSGGDLSREGFYLQYESYVNRFFFNYSLNAYVEYTGLQVEWNQMDRILYNFKSKTVESDLKAAVRFYDSLTVRGITYEDIIEVDYTDQINEIDRDTPVKTYISGKLGLIKFVRKDKIVFERIVESVP